MCASGGEYSDSGREPCGRPLPIPLRVSPGFAPGSLDRLTISNLIRAGGGSAIALAGSPIGWPPKSIHGSVDGEAGERPARARHCDRAKARRTPCGSHWPRGREGAAGRLGSQETSLRSLHQALEERGSRMRAVSFRRALRALRGALSSLGAAAGDRRGHVEPDRDRRRDRQGGRSTCAPSRKPRPANRSTRPRPSAATGWPPRWPRPASDAADVRGRARRPEPAGLPARRVRRPIWDDDPPRAAPLADYERAILIAHAAGLDPARLSADLQPAGAAGRPLEPGRPAASATASSNSTAFGDPGAEDDRRCRRWALAPAVAFLRRNQHDDGGWTYSAALTPAAQREPSEPDMTGAAIAALCEAGVPAYDPDVAAGAGLPARAAGRRDRRRSTTLGRRQRRRHRLGGQRPQRLRDRPAVGGLDDRGGQDADRPPALAAGPGRAGEAGGFGYEDAERRPNLYSTQDALRAIAGGVFTARRRPRDPSQPASAPPRPSRPGPPSRTCWRSSWRPATCGSAR